MKMETLSIRSSLLIPLNAPPSFLRSSVSRISRPPHRAFRTQTLRECFAIKADSSASNPVLSNQPPVGISPLKAVGCAVIFATMAFGKFRHLPAIAMVPPRPAETLAEDLFNSDVLQEKEETTQNSPLSQLLESNPEAIEALRTLLQEKLEAGEDEEGLSILKKLTATQPENAEWKFLMARLLNEMGRVQEARAAFEEILAKNPLSFEALFENALLMDRSGERESVMERLEEALRVAENEQKPKEARDVKLIMAQMQFLHKNVDEALESYDELVKEDPTDFRPYFCKGMIFSLMGRNDEAKEQFDLYRQFSPKKFEIEGYLRTPLSRMKLFGTDE